MLASYQLPSDRRANKLDRGFPSVDEHGARVVNITVTRTMRSCNRYIFLFCSVSLVKKFSILIVDGGIFLSELVPVTYRVRQKKIKEK